MVAATEARVRVTRSRYSILPMTIFWISLVPS